MNDTAKQRRASRREGDSPEFLSEYVAGLPRVRQVIGEKSMAHTAGAVATYIEKISTQIHRSIIEKNGKGALNPSAGRKVIINSSWKIIGKLSLIAGVIHNLAERSLRTRIDQLNELDSKLIQRAHEKGYFGSVLPVSNHLTGYPTALITEVNGQQRVTVRNTYSSYISDFNEKPGKQNPVMKNDWLRAFTLFHEMAHAEFLKMDRNFQPTPGLFLKDPDKEQRALDAINKWATHPAVRDLAPNLAYDVLNESHSDALAALIVIKEGGNSPQARAAVEDEMYNLRENQRLEVQGLGFVGTGYMYTGCPYALDEVLRLGDDVLDMDVEQIREKAVEISSNSLLDAARGNPERHNEYLNGLSPRRSLSSLYLTLKRAAVAELSENIEAHPLSTVAKYDLRWLENRYGPIYKSIEKPGGKNTARINPKLLKVLSSDFLSWSEDELEINRPPRGVSRDVYQGRVNIISQFHEQWKQDVQIASSAVAEYKENVESERKMSAGHFLNDCSEADTPSPPAPGA